MNDPVAPNEVTEANERDPNLWKVLPLRSPRKRVKRRRLKLHWKRWFNIPVPILHLETFEFELQNAPVDHEALASQLQEILEIHETSSYQLFSIMPLSSGYHGITSSTKPSPYTQQRVLRQLETRWASDTLLLLFRKKENDAVHLQDARRNAAIS